MAGNLTDDQWRLIVNRIGLQMLTPILGAGVSYGHYPLGADLARALAEEFKYPFADSYDLVRVSQYIALTRDAMFPKNRIVQLFDSANTAAFRERFNVAGPPDFADSSDPHLALARLRLPLFITTNYDDSMVRALIKEYWDPTQELCRWNRQIEHVPSKLYDGAAPTVANPAVFHLHGYTTYYVNKQVASAPHAAASLVLTEDDFLDFLVNMSSRENFLPPVVRRAIVGSTLLFLGYRIADWNFRVLLNGLSRFLERGQQYHSFAVMLPPSEEGATKEQVQEYLGKYYARYNVTVYWGTVKEFFAELKQRM